ncbi:alpha/beta hydrolase [Methanococcus sp. CF]
MIKNNITIDGIPAILWGKEQTRLIIAVHGNMSSKDDTVIQILSKIAVKKGYQVLSFDLPEHGDRKNDKTPCKVNFCVNDLEKMMKYAKNRWNKISLFACSIGAYFSLLTYSGENLEKSLFLSPVVDMKRIIQNMMNWFNVTPERLEKEKEIETPIGQKLYWDYFCYVYKHPIESWNFKTSILYGSNDDLCEYDTIDNFVKRFKCNLEIVDSGEHYFHTTEQMNSFEIWLEKEIE